MVGNPIPGFTVAMIGLGMALTMGLLMEFMVAGMFGDGEAEIDRTTFLLGMIGIFLLIIAVWTIIDGNKRMAAEK
jgi:hypothetical protein